MPSPNRGDALEDRIELADPDPAWPGQYAAEASALLSILPDVAGLRLEHFGSTAIPNIRAKPIIDILIVHPQPACWPDLIGPIASLGYVHWSENPRKDRMFFVKGMPPFGARRTHHVHVRVPADASAELRFRDALRADPLLAGRYGVLKDALAIRHADDRDAYTAAKTDFIEKVLGAMSEQVLRGSCLCGSVRYEVRAPFLEFAHCHCSRCRKASGSSHATNLYASPERFRWLDGQDAVTRFDLPSARSFATTFCRNCGGPLPHHTRSGRVIVVPAGSLDDAPAGKPRAHIFWSSRAPWITDAAGLPAFDAYADGWGA